MKPVNYAITLACVPLLAACGEQVSDDQSRSVVGEAVMLGYAYGTAKKCEMTEADIFDERYRSSLKKLGLSNLRTYTNAKNAYDRASDQAANQPVSKENCDFYEQIIQENLNKVN